MSRIERVLAPNPGPFTLDGTNTWVLGDGPSIVIDPGPDDPDHLRTVAETAGSVAAILLTHHHPDHAPGAARLAAWTGAQVRALVPADGERALAPGEVVSAPGASLRVLPTPGHTADHAAFLEPASGSLFTGDAVLGSGTSVIDPPDGDLADYLRSLRAMLEARPRRILPGHGPEVDDAPGKLRDYLAHRAERERQVLEGLAGGPRTPRELVAAIYTDTPEALHPVAARSVLAHLLKLEAEGRVIRAAPGAERFARSDR